MANETKQISKLVVEIGNTDWELSPNGGTPGENTVGTEQLKPGAVTDDDLSAGVKQDLEKGASAYQKPAEGIPVEDLDDDVRENLGDLTPEATEADVVAIVTDYNNN